MIADTERALLPVPQCSPVASYLEYQAPIDDAIGKVLRGGQYILGQQTEAFEREFASYIGVAGAVGVASGTDALVVALRACGVRPGDIVYTVSQTATATATAIDLCGATPVFIDIDATTYTMDAVDLERAIRDVPGGRPKAVVPVHLYGQPADLDAICEIASIHGLRVIEDCAQAHGAVYRGRKVGGWGDLAAFSFYPTKNLGALGDGGILVTNDRGLEDAARLIRQYGWKERFVSSSRGMNSRLDELQAAILRVKLKHLDAANQARRVVAAAYDAALSGTGLALPRAMPSTLHVYHQYVVGVPDRDALRRKLTDCGVGTAIHYPVPVHRQPTFADVPIRRTLPNTDAAASGILSLPMYPQLSPGQVAHVTRSVLASLVEQAP